MIVDNRAMRSSIRPVLRSSLVCFALFLAQLLPFPAIAADALLDRFPPSAIDSNEKADAALSATGGAKQRAESEYKATARECVKKFMVNQCIAQARTLRHDRLADIDAVQLEANRFKRRDKSDRLEAERAQREAERAANAKADAALRARNRQNHDDRQGQAKRDAAERARSEAARAGRAGAARSPLIKVPKPGSPEANAAQRAKNATDQAAKIKDAALHREQLSRRHAEKEADRARRAEQQARKETERKTAQTPAHTPAVTKP